MRNHLVDLVGRQQRAVVAGVIVLGSTDATTGCAGWAGRCVRRVARWWFGGRLRMETEAGLQLTDQGLVLLHGREQCEEQHTHRLGRCGPIGFGDLGWSCIL